MSDDKYQLCSCGSGKKFKFCCYERREAFLSLSNETLAGRATELPVHQCFVNRKWKQAGLAQVMVSRKLPDGKSLMGAYLVDVWCLGVKDSFIERLKADDVQPFLSSFPDFMDEISYEDARSIILGAIEFATQFGFAPHESWSVTCSIVEGDRFFIRKFEFGDDRKAVYIEGLDDDTPRILQQLEPFVKDGMADYYVDADADEDVFLDWCEEIWNMIEDDELEDALAEIESITEQYPQRWEPLYFKALCLMLEDNWSQAIPPLKQAIAIHPSPEAYFSLAEAYRSLFCIEDWLECLKRVIELDGDTGDIGEKAKSALDDFASTTPREKGFV